ncbi:MAG: ribosome-binding factor A [Alteromonadaceae bacterium]|mgnify:CR=1 FL=1|jgi:ribosome-binding factor A|uniref:Ribosome-binding factor A n=2 Tax=Paraglaciecola mesophila TaxID=197222 RepID=K6Z6K4_9ALTE|nr:30S ribosome-binding factor RbfA [Paraglaciecola mesophila]MAD14574.1 ribosome-binding factor A [Alteromonadaceae bacterium]MBB20090.1 ribosome-binding factor A [Rickettsiales bacterium]GAC26022.1 ribosome-binding factor A [Paraglaciecola mesophila KMM 241]|tara:strand:+ start:2542 stop:2958 length:417 start_codon:yes stop_codon:yes gene_type:complete
MAREFSRTDRVGQQIHKEIASILQNEFKNRDPRLGMVTVSAVEVSRDLAYTKIYVTFFENDEEVMNNYLSILEENKGYIRTLLANRMRMRAVPAIKFVRDGSLSEGIRISNLVDETLNKDKERARNAGRSLDEDEQED